MRKSKIIKSYVTEAEYAKIRDNALFYNVSVSTYLRKICLDFPLKSKVDRQAHLELIKANADLARLGNLLKASLAQNPELSDIKKLAAEISQAKSQVQTQVEAITQALLQGSVKL